MTHCLRLTDGCGLGRRRQVAREKEYAEREAARRAAAAEFAGEPYHKEVGSSTVQDPTGRGCLCCRLSARLCLQIGLCEQLISHLGKYQQQAQDSTPTASLTASSGATDVFEGMKAVKKKGDEEEEGFGG